MFTLGLIDEWLPHPRRNGDVRVGSILLKKSDTRQRQLLLEFFREVEVQSETVLVSLRAV